MPTEPGAEGAAQGAPGSADERNAGGSSDTRLGEGTSASDPAPPARGAEPGGGAAPPSRGALMRALPTPAARSLTLSPSMARRHVPPYATGRLREGTKARWQRPGLPSNERRARARPGSAARGCGNGDGGARRGGSAVWAPELRRREAFLAALGFLGRSEDPGRARTYAAPRCCAVGVL